MPKRTSAAKKEKMQRDESENKQEQKDASSITGSFDDQEYNYNLRVSKDRVAVLIGKNGSVKKEIEDLTNSKLDIDSKEGDVVISGKDSLGLYNAKEVIRAIGRGFNPDIALLLLKGDYVFEIINLNEILGKNKKVIMRLKGRVIGSEGKSRKNIEMLTETYISVYGKTISIIGEPMNALIAKKAIESLLAGSPHSSVNKWLEKKRSELKMKMIEDTLTLKKEMR